MFGHDLKPYELFGYPFFFGVLAVVIARAFPSVEMTIFLWAFEINVAFIGSFYLFHEGAKYVDAVTPSQSPKPSQVVDERPTEASDDMPQIKVGGMLMRSQDVETVSINAIAKFNQHLITQHVGNLPINMTENYWVKKNNGSEQSEWVRIGGTGPTDWKNFIERGVRWGAYGTEGGQDKRVPLNWRKISQLAQGYPLPRLTTSPVSNRAKQEGK